MEKQDETVIVLRWEIRLDTITKAQPVKQYEINLKCDEGSWRKTHSRAEMTLHRKDIVAGDRKSIMKVSR